MRRFITCLLAATACLLSHSYNDYRGHNLDSLEREVGRWTPQAIDGASDGQLLALNRACRDLMLGYSQLNGDKCVFYARKALEISRRKGWVYADSDAYRYIGQQFYGREQFDSALVYYRKSMECVEQMAGGAVSVTNPEGYSEKEIDDQLSALYGSIGNVYNLMDSIPQAMDWYGKAGAIFEKYGWRESSSVLYYNIGETWVDEGNPRKAIQAYGKALQYARGDSLMVANAQKGLGRAYMELGKTGKALHFLHEADRYYSAHDKEEPVFTKENYEYMSATLIAQRKQILLMAGETVLILLMLLGILLLRKKLRRSRIEQSEVSEVLEETIREIGHPASAEDAPQVSAREKEILDLLAKGYTTPQIAGALVLSPETIKWYRKKLLVKFDVANTAELVNLAREYGIL